MLDDDGLPMDEVGPWAKEKHERLRRYVDISRAARRRWVQGRNGATYIDLYCGTGRAIIRDSSEKIDGSPLVAFKCAREGGVPFSKVHIADASEESCRAAQQRLINLGGSPLAEVGAAEETVRRIVKQLNPYGLHFAFLDPYNLQDLPFSVIEAFSSLKYIDMLIHVSAQDLQRNLDAYSMSDDDPLDTFAPGWRNAVDLKQTQVATRAAFITYWASRIESLGLPPAQRAELVSGTTKNQRLYWLVFVSRSDFVEPLLGPIIDLDLTGIHWVIVGGESGPRARPMEAWWVEELRDLCRRQGIAFFFKQWGGKRKKQAGRVLAGRTWDEYPGIAIPA